MPRGRYRFATRLASAAVLLALSVTGFTDGAAGQDAAAIRAELDAAAAEIADLEAAVHQREERIHEIEERTEVLERRSRKLHEQAAKRAGALYRAGGPGMLALLFGSETLAELQDRAEALSKLSLEGQGVFMRLYRDRIELEQLRKDLAAEQKELSETLEQMQQESEALQARFSSLSSAYQSAPTAFVAAPRSKPRGGMVCPVAGPVSFVDSWGAARAGHYHQGVDMMAAYGTPIVAITTGTVTYASYNGSGGYMIFLTGDDGNDYWYMHNQQNFVGAGARVRVGQQIAAVGDTGNAEGTPHLHFEYHPGGGGPVNPYPLVAGIC